MTIRPSKLASAESKSLPDQFLPDDGCFPENCGFPTELLIASLRAERSNPGATSEEELDRFVARAPRDDEPAVFANSTPGVARYYTAVVFKDFLVCRSSGEAGRATRSAPVIIPGRQLRVE
jgi:hypothetical protein